MISPATADASGVIEELQWLITAAAMSQAIAVAAELRIADLLAAGPLTIEELAAATQCDAPSLRRLLRALASIGWCADPGDGTVALVGDGVALQRDSGSMLDGYARWWGQYRWPAWGELLHSIRTGERAAGTVSGKPGMKDFDRSSAAAPVFHQAMVGLTREVSLGVLRAISFERSRRVVDIGGGYGALLSALLEAHPHLHGVLYDLPHALEGARDHVARAGLASRCEFVGGNFFDYVPAGADTYVLKTILHDWSDDECVRILSRCREVSGAGTRLLLIEHVLPERVENSRSHQRSAIADLNMLVMLGGKERTVKEFEAVLARADFVVTSISDAALGYSVIEARTR